MPREAGLSALLSDVKLRILVVDREKLVVSLEGEGGKAFLFLTRRLAPMFDNKSMRDQQVRV